MIGLKCDWPCWEIMNCDESKKCPARTRPDIPCWEIAGEMNDYRYVLQVCPDCIVHLLKGSNQTLSQNDIQTIMLHKANRVLTSDECWMIY